MTPEEWIAAGTAQPVGTFAWPAEAAAQFAPDNGVYVSQVPLTYSGVKWLWRRTLGHKVDKLAMVRIGSARYFVPHLLRGRHVDVVSVDDRIEIWHEDDLVAQHRLVPPGGTSVLDEHYDRPARKPARAVRPRNKAEQAFLALGEEAEAFLRAAAAAGTSRLPAHIAAIAALRDAHGPDAVAAALRRAVEFRRFTADDVRAILAAGPAAPTPRPPGAALGTALPKVPTRNLDTYRTDSLREVA